MDRGAWWATIHGVIKSWTRLSDFCVCVCVCVSVCVCTLSALCTVTKKKKKILEEQDIERKDPFSSMKVQNFP